MGYETFKMVIEIAFVVVVAITIIQAMRRKKK
jgi:hypothetical protein